MSSKKKRRKKRQSRNQGVSTIEPKQKGTANDANRPSAGTGQTPPSDSTDEINRLISKGKAKAAVSKAKLYHKHHGTDKSETLLVDAYAARIREMLSRRYHVEAKTLLELIRERYDCPDRLLTELDGLIAIQEGRVDDLVRPLEGPDLSPEKRSIIQAIIKNELIDLNLLAQSTGLSVDHSLKTGAQAVAEAFAKVTSGSVNDAEITLAAISRRSPPARRGSPRRRTDAGADGGECAQARRRFSISS